MRLLLLLGGALLAPACRDAAKFSGITRPDSDTGDPDTAAPDDTGDTDDTGEVTTVPHAEGYRLYGDMAQVKTTGSQAVQASDALPPR